MGKLAERLRRDAGSGGLYDAERRYVMLRADVLMGVFNRLAPAARQEALAALAASVEAGGGDSARAYFAAVDQDVAALLAVMADSAADLGWGRWRFDGPRAGALALEVQGSPFAAAAAWHDAPACHAIAGMLATVGSLVLGVPAEVRESQCAGMGAACCRFEVRAAA